MYCTYASLRALKFPRGVWRSWDARKTLVTWAELGSGDISVSTSAHGGCLCDDVGFPSTMATGPSTPPLVEERDMIKNLRPKTLLCPLGPVTRCAKWPGRRLSVPALAPSRPCS
ncbi:hypothetical protein VFPPC_17548 [Pochonia chlamydosporia 170]|uniref:Uncharacterized protein n=1 Tax=Pochonia chlamydosporia 170 TaxID=1380566 RepID=A0A219ART2_METCM|nr:hypothetical protein VFPPC_17548 [Pochonia chlamydosporia 170]OWT43289.1 hypothetical protein VFPPC_17548 [Pochonia chlamydosporia 170]